MVGTGCVSADPSADAGLVPGSALLLIDRSRITQGGQATGQIGEPAEHIDVIPRGVGMPAVKGPGVRLAEPPKERTAIAQGYCASFHEIFLKGAEAVRGELSQF